MKVLIVGADVIGTVYGRSWPRPEPRSQCPGLSARDVLDGGQIDAAVTVVPDTCGDYDVVLVAVRREQLTPACAGLAGLAGEPAIVFPGNNRAGRADLPGDLPGDVYLGFPGVGGTMAGGTAEYGIIRQRPTALQQAPDHRPAALASALSGCGLAVQRIAALRASGTAGLRRNLPVLHAPILRPAAIRYWPVRCAHRWASCASPHTAAMPVPRCGQSAVTRRHGAPGNSPWQSCSVPDPLPAQAQPNRNWNWSRRWTVVDALPADGMQEIWGSNPHSSTGKSDKSKSSP